MAQFSFPKVAWSEAIFDRLLKAIKQSVETADYDSGWIARPGGNIVTHDLGTVPSEVFVYASASGDGSGFAAEAFSNCNTRTITLSGTTAYVKVRANR